MSEAASMNFSVTIPGKSRSPRIARMLTLERLIEWIKSQDLDEHTTKSLIYLASRYPSHALPLFKKNFNLMLQRARAMRKADSTGPVEKKEAEPVAETFESLDAGLNQVWKEPKNAKEDSLEEIIDDWKDDSLGDACAVDDQTDSDPLRQPGEVPTDLQD